MAEPTKEQLEKAETLIKEWSNAWDLQSDKSDFVQQADADLYKRIATALAEAAAQNPSYVVNCQSCGAVVELFPSVPVSEAAEICAEMAREAATIMVRHNSNFLESGSGIDAALTERYRAKSEAFREAERRIRARIEHDSKSETLRGSR